MTDQAFLAVVLSDDGAYARKLRMCLVTRADRRGMTVWAHRNVRRARRAGVQR